MAKKAIISIDVEDIKSEVSPIDVSVSQCINQGTLPDGRSYQIQVLITTDEDDFVDQFSNLDE